MASPGREPAVALVAVEQVAEVLGVERRLVAEYVELGLVRPAAQADPPALTDSDVARLSRALRLARELEVHSAAAALLVELLEERDALRRQLICLERLAGGDV